MSLPETYRGQELVGSQTAQHPLSVLQARERDHLDIQPMLAILRRRILMFILWTLIGLGLAILFSLRSPVLYTATSYVVLNDTVRQLTPKAADENTPDVPHRSDQIDTEISIIGSRDLAGKVFDYLHLDQDKAFMNSATSVPAFTKFQRKLFGAWNDTPPSKAELRERAIDYITAKKIDAEKQTTSYAIQISYTDGNADRAARIANAYAKIYVDDQAAIKQQTDQKAVDAQRGRLEQLRQQAHDDYAAAQDYRVRNNLLSKTGTSLTENELSTYNQGVATARAEAANDQAAFAAARAQYGRGVGDVGEQSGVLQGLRTERATLSAHVVDLSSRYLDTHPDLVDARKQLADLDRQIDQEVRRTINGLAAKSQASSQRLSSLQGTQSVTHATLSTNNQALVALDGLDRKAAASQAVYNAYAQSYQEAVAKLGTELPDSRMISNARTPPYQSSPVWMLNLPLGLLLGMLVGGASAILSETSFSGLTTGDDVEQKLDMPYFGGVPMLKSVTPRAGSLLATIAQYPGGAIAESMRGVLTSLRQTNNSRNQVIAITSAIPGEGKSSITSGVAVVAGLAGERVAIIDCDVVRNTLSRMFMVDMTKPGLRELLNDNATLEQIKFIEPVANVAIYPITTQFERGARLIDKGKLNRMIAKLREDYDLILLDCSPILPIAETRELVTLADNVGIIATWRKSDVRAVRAALKLLPLRLIDHIGVVLNMIDMRKRKRFGFGDSAAFYDRYKDYYLPVT